MRGVIKMDFSFKEANFIRNDDGTYMATFVNDVFDENGRKISDMKFETKRLQILKFETKLLIDFDMSYGNIYVVGQDD